MPSRTRRSICEDRRLLSDLSSSITERRSITSWSAGSSMSTGLLLTRSARLAKCSVFMVSSALAAAGEQHAIMSDRPRPPRESMRSCVSLESRKGTCEGLSSPARRPLRVEITLPRANSERLILPVSHTAPAAVLPVCFRRSLPAKSTKVILPKRRYASDDTDGEDEDEDAAPALAPAPAPRPTAGLDSTLSVSRQCEREDCSLRLCARTWRCDSPRE
mmetsp:Transcript_19280/g.47769  ORF Transcript_19280/g.47769 Transcript_19280/m.47769 type:complete len:218 (+) Transcript_19280:272-925(+)